MSTNSQMTGRLFPSSEYPPSPVWSRFPEFLPNLWLNLTRLRQTRTAFYEILCDVSLTTDLRQYNTFICQRSATDDDAAERQINRPCRPAINVREHNPLRETY